MTLYADFASQDYFRNPGAAIEKLRTAGPVVEVRFPIIGKVWTTTTQALADQVLKDTSTFTMRKEDGTVAGYRWWMPGIVRILANSMLSMDEPDHKRLRDIVDEAFRRRAVLDMEPHIQAIGDELADELFAEGTPADLVERYARTLPLSVICELLGLPLADRPKFMAWASGFTRFSGALGFPGAIPNLYAWKRCPERHLETVLDQGGDGCVGMWAGANRDGQGTPHPQRLDLQRKPNRHIAFGTGIHFCLGHQLARIEGRCALKSLLQRWPTLTVGVDEQEIRFRKRPGIRAIDHLPVMAGPAQRGGSNTAEPDMVAHP